jgi:hypothetical protein
MNVTPFYLTGVLSVAVLAASAAPAPTSDPTPLTVHEWGTFTSVAAADGSAVEWMTQGGPQDLPCFVERVPTGVKGLLNGTVRMETPVLYFYAPQPLTVNVSVSFNNGFITEWYPRANVSPSNLDRPAVLGRPWRSRAEWTNVTVSKRAAEDFPKEAGPSHYYAARATDAAPVQVGGQKEKFLFYRGVGRFAPPLNALVRADGHVDVAHPDGASLGTVILFENRAGVMGWRRADTREPRVRIERPQPGATIPSMRRELEALLVERGLFPKEAAAMMETWRDSWFEEGTRVFYIPSQQAIDAILPLDIKPVPADVSRVFVGRVELLTPQMVRDAKKHILAGDTAAVLKHGRFVQAIADRVVTESAPAERGRLNAQLAAVYTAYFAPRNAALANCR